MKKYILCLIATSLLITNCGLFKNKKRKALTLETPMLSKNWTYLSARLDAKTQIQGSNRTLGISLRMKKDSITWFSVSAMFGIQIAKGVMTADSIWLLNKFSKEYYAMSMDDISKISGADVNLNQLQNALVGASIFDTPTQYVQDSTGYIGIQDIFSNFLQLHSDNSIAKSTLTKSVNKDTMLFEYSSQLDAGSFWVPENIAMNGKSDKKNIHIDLKYKTVNDNIITSFPFVIPSGYKKR